MATIRPNDHAPSDEVTYTLPGATFELAPGGSYESDDRVVLSDAEAHPWLEVEYPVLVDESESRESRSVPYEDDALSAPNSLAFDPDAVAKAHADEVVTNPTAIDSGLDQGEPAESGDGRVATSLASADEVEAVEPAPAPAPSWTSSSDSTPKED